MDIEVDDEVSVRIRGGQGEEGVMERRRGPRISEIGLTEGGGKHLPNPW